MRRKNSRGFAGSIARKTKSPMTQRAFVELCHFAKIWSGRRDSNPRPRPWQGRALPLSYTRIREIGGDDAPATGRAMPNALPECNSRHEGLYGRIVGQIRRSGGKSGQKCPGRVPPIANWAFKGQLGLEKC